MSERSYHAPQTQGIKHIDYNVTVLPNGATGPTLGEGDPNGNWTIPAGQTGATGPWRGSFMSVFKSASGVTGATGVTGTYLVQTNDPFAAVVNQLANIVLASPTASYTISFGPPIQQPDNSWIIWFTVYNGTVATDLPLGSQVSLHMTFRNSITKP